MEKNFDHPQYTVAVNFQTLFPYTVLHHKPLVTGTEEYFSLVDILTTEVAHCSTIDEALTCLASLSENQLTIALSSQPMNKSEAAWVNNG